MKSWTVAVLVVCGLLLGLSSLTVAQNHEGQLAKAKQLNQQADQLYKAGRFAEAIPLAERSLAIRERVLGPEHLDTATSLNNLASLYQANGDYTRAAPLYERALAIGERVRGPEHPEVAISLNNLASLYQAQGDYARSMPLYQRSLVILEHALGPQHPDVARSLSNLAGLYEATGDYARAAPLYERSLAILEKALGPEHPDVATALENLAALYHDTSDYARAAPLYQRALAILEKTLGPQHPSVATALNNLAELYRETGDYARAAPLYQRALAIRGNALGPEHPLVAQSLNNLAGLYQTTGDYAGAEALYQRALAILEKALGPEHRDVAPSLNNLASLYQATGDYARAAPLYQRALAILENALGPEHPLVAQSLNNLAGLYQATGDYARAAPLYQHALAIKEKALGPEHPDVATSLNNLAVLYQATGDYTRAAPLYQRALVIDAKALGPEHPSVATDLDNLAALHRAAGDYARAAPLYERSLAIREKALGPEHPDVATSLNNLALLYYTTGDYTRSAPLFQHSLAIREKALGPEHPDVATSLNNLASLFQATGDYTRAGSLTQRAADVREKNIVAILDIGSQQQKQLYLNTLSGETDRAVSLHAQDTPQDADAARLAVTTILRRKGRALDAFTSQLEALRHRAAPADKKLLDDLAAVEAQLANLQLGAFKFTLDARRAEVARLTAQQEGLEDIIGRSSAEFRATTEPVTLERVQAALPTDAALVELFVYQPFNAKPKGAERKYGVARYLAYVVRRNDSVPQFADLGEAAPVDADVERLRSLLGNPPLRKKDEMVSDAEQQARMQHHEEQVKELARILDERVMRPVRKLLGETKQVFLSPDGALNLIPFDALVDENGQYLIENYSFNYLTSGRDLLRLQVPIASRNPPAVLANPLYDMVAAGAAVATEENRRSMDFALKTYPPLPGTAEEATALGGLWPEMQVLTQEQATEYALKQLQSPRILHIATHGFFEPDQPRELPPPGPASGRATVDTLSLPAVSLSAVGAPLSQPWENPLLRSGLVLAGVKQQHSGAGEDGVLTALETAGLDLWGTKLVVLSACETGLGDVQNGQGVYGLRRALVLAGSQTQVMSLWKVSDEGTRDLMTAYYTRLKAGEGRTQAMRQVQLAMLRGELKATQGATDYRHPYYWAAFISSGDWRNMDGKEYGIVATRSSLRLVAILLPVVGVVGGFVLFLFLLRWLRSRRLKRAT
jgi:CHAT domain-containing protein/Tfp pilus assembly protein PilF